MKISVNENKASGVSVVETLEMSQKPVVCPIEQISAHSGEAEEREAQAQLDELSHQLLSASISSESGR